MLRKIVLGVAAAAAIGAATFSPTSANASPYKIWHPHKHHHGWHGGGFGYYGSYAFGGCYQKRWVPTPFGYRFRWVNVCY